MAKKMFAVVLTMVIIFCIPSCGLNGPSAEDLYSSIQRCLKEVDGLKSNYFIQFIDTKDLEAAEGAAEKAVSESDEKSYKDVLRKLEAEIASVKERIKKESGKYYNAPTSDDLEEEFPFKVDQTKENASWDYRPLVMQSSRNPVWIITEQPETTDDTVTLLLFVNSSSATYDFEFKNIATKEIQVQDEEGEIQTALVNTEVVITAQTGFDYLEEVSFYNANPAYLIVDKTGKTLLALKTRDQGSDYYILYG